MAWKWLYWYGFVGIYSNPTIMNIQLEGKMKQQFLVLPHLPLLFNKVGTPQQDIRAVPHTRDAKFHSLAFGMQIRPGFSIAIVLELAK